MSATSHSLTREVNDLVLAFCSKIVSGRCLLALGFREPGKSLSSASRFSPLRP
jgi:hypothetical protein